MEQRRLSVALPFVHFSNWVSTTVITAAIVGKYWSWMQSFRAPEGKPRCLRFAPVSAAKSCQKPFTPSVRLPIQPETGTICAGLTFHLADFG